MDDQRLLRYSRQIMLPEIDIEKQQKLLDSHALIIGLGGLGSPVAMYLAAAGIGQLTLVDNDEVDLSNLQRQIIHGTANIGQSKVGSAQTCLQDLNPDCQVHTYSTRLEPTALAETVTQTDIVLDCSDNFATRFLLNKTCHAHKTPLVSGAAIRWEGQVSVFSYAQNTACYRCLYADTGEEDVNCSENGVIAPLVGIIGSMQALEAIKVLTQVGEPLTSRLFVLDTLQQNWRSLRLQPDPECPVCGLNTVIM
jgi:molybdopterin/thiamine biosynthesis adenylyltransferase